MGWVRYRFNGNESGVRGASVVKLGWNGDPQDGWFAGEGVGGPGAVFAELLTSV